MAYRRYYDLFMDMAEGRGWHVGQLQANDGSTFPSGIFQMGQVFTALCQFTLTKVIVYDEPSDFYITPGAGPVVSTRFANAIDAFDPGTFQRIPIRIAGFPELDYVIMNITRVVSAIDFEASGETLYFDYGNRIGQIKYVRSPRIRQDLNPDLHIFRPQEYPLPIIISQGLKEYLDRQYFIGLDMQPLYDPQDE